MAGIPQQGVGGILPETDPVVSDNPSIEILPAERQEKNPTEQSQRRDALSLPDAASIQEGADLKIVKERCNLAVQAFCFLLFRRLLNSIHGSPFVLILLRNSQIPIYQDAKGFSR